VAAGAQTMSTDRSSLSRITSAAGLSSVASFGRLKSDSSNHRCSLLTCTNTFMALQCKALQR